MLREFPQIETALTCRQNFVIGCRCDDDSYLCFVRESYDDEDDKHRFVYDVTADDGDDMVTIVKEEETEKWDCESILSECFDLLMTSLFE